MAWPFKKEEPEGTKTPEEPKPNETPKESQEDLIKRLFSENFTPLNEKFSALETKVNSLTERPAPQPTPENVPSVLDDENAAFRTRLNPVEGATLLAHAKLALLEVKEEYPTEVWKHFEKDIRSEVSQGAPQAQANPAFIRNVADMVIGRSARQNGYRYDGTSKHFFLEDASQVSESTNPTSEADRQFLEYQVALPPNRDGKQKIVSRKAFLEGMGVSAEDSKKAMAKLQVVS